jgi:hypothetical protein
MTSDAPAAPEVHQITDRPVVDVAHVDGCYLLLYLLPALQCC